MINVKVFFEELGRSCSESFEAWLAKEPVKEEVPLAPDFEKQKESLQSSLPCGYSLVFQSRDGKLLLYQDKDGRLCVARAEKLV